MPYVITTTDQTRHAVATLDEARGAAFAYVEETLLGDGPSDPRFARVAHELPESGGTVGPLPDGTVIVVYQVSWEALVDLVADEREEVNLQGYPMPNPSGPVRKWIIDAYNAEQEAARV